LKVQKFGGSCLKDAESFNRAADIVASDKEPRIVVVSAIHGVTDIIDSHLKESCTDENCIAETLKEIRDRHLEIIYSAIKDKANRKEVIESMDAKTKKLERVLYGVAYTEELTSRTRDLIMSFGERMSAPILAACLKDRGLESRALDTDAIGVITNGEFGNATAHLSKVEESFKSTIKPLLEKGAVPVLTGYFGADPEGRVTTFGRGGSDYSAGVVAHALEADILEIWKDVDGFMTVDPKFVGEARVIEKISYLEAAELAYFGAKILHPRTVEPLMAKGIPIHVKNVFKPQDSGTLIVGEAYETPETIKSVAYSKDVGVLKIHGAGVGYKPGVLNRITGAVSAHGMNIKSVITSQTCISLLLEMKDLDRVHDILKAENWAVVEKLEKVRDVAIVGIVGEGIITTKGLAGKAFTAVAESGINVEMISAGASAVAYYFLVNQKDLETTVKAVHRAFFGK
jgi:aspartate kinase